MVSSKGFEDMVGLRGASVGSWARLVAVSRSGPLGWEPHSWTSRIPRVDRPGDGSGSVQRRRRGLLRPAQWRSPPTDGSSGRP
jgi:hypothetical protein